MLILNVMLLVPLVFLMCHSLPLLQEHDKSKQIVSVFHVITTSLDKLKCLLGIENQLNMTHSENMTTIETPIQFYDSHHMMTIRKNVSTAIRNIVSKDKTTRKRNSYTDNFLPTRTWFTSLGIARNQSTIQPILSRRFKSVDIPVSIPMKRNIIPSTCYSNSPIKLNLVTDFSNNVTKVDTEAVTSDQNTAFVHALTSLHYMDIIPRSIGFILPLGDASTIPYPSDHMVKTSQGLSGRYSITPRPTTKPKKITTERSNININSSITMTMIEPEYDAHKDKENTNDDDEVNYVTTTHPSEITNSNETMTTKIIRKESEAELSLVYDRSENNFTSEKTFPEALNVENDYSKINFTTSDDLSDIDESISQNDISTDNIGNSTTASITDQSPMLQKEGSHESANQHENNRSPVIDDSKMKEQDIIMSTTQGEKISTSTIESTTVAPKLTEHDINGMQVEIPEITTQETLMLERILNDIIHNDSKQNINLGNTNNADKSVQALFDDILNQIEQMDTGNKAGNGRKLPKYTTLSSLEKNRNATDIKSFLFDLFGASVDSSTKISSTSEVFNITLQKSREENECEGKIIHREAYALIPNDNSPAMITLLWDANRCEGAIPSDIHVDVYGSSLDHTANIYLLRGNKKCGAFAAVPKDAWLLATVELKNNAGSTLTSWPSLTLTKLQGSHVIVENLNTGKLMCATLN